MSKRIAIFPGSFDPFTRGHESIVHRVLPLFDELVIAIGVNANKNYYYSLEQRQRWIEEVFNGDARVKVTSFKGLTVDYCRQLKASYIVRGLRTSADFEFEKAIAQMNKALASEIETLFILPVSELSAINSTIIRDIVRNNGDASAFVPAAVKLYKV